MRPHILPPSPEFPNVLWLANFYSVTGQHYGNHAHDAQIMPLSMPKVGLARPQEGNEWPSDATVLHLLGDIGQVWGTSHTAVR